MGVTVRQKRPGRGNSWHVFVHQDNRIISRRVGTKHEAERVAAEIRRRMLAGDFSLQENRTSRGRVPEFAAYADRYIERYAKVACKRNTWKSYEALLRNHLLPEWGSIPIDEITRADVRRLLLQKQQEGLRPGTVINIKALVSGIFTHACEEELLDRNPALKMGKYIRKDDRRRHIVPLSADQVRLVLATARDECRNYYPVLLCAFRTGMRMGELLGLAWEDVDMVACTIKVRRSYSHGHFDTPKSHKERTIDMSDQLAATLLAHHGELSRRRGGLPACEVPSLRGRRETVHLVFPDRTGGPIDGDNLRHRVFYRLLEITDVPRFRFHDIRHTFASLLLQNGESLHYVKEQMGHASIQTTVDVYGHLVPGANRNAVNRLDDDEGPALRLAGGEVG